MDNPQVSPDPKIEFFWKKFSLSYIFLILLIAIFAVANVYLWSNYFNLSEQEQSLSEVTQRIYQTSEPFIAESHVSEEIKIESQLIAKKANLERKIIKPKEGVNIKAIELIVEEQGGRIIKSDSNLIVAEVPQELEAEVEAGLTSLNSVESFEVDQPTYIAADSQDWGVTRIEAPEVWSTTNAGGIKIGVIDTGVDYSHPDIASRYGGGYDTVNEDYDPFDDHGHGTHVSGTIAADLNDAGIVGVAPGATILAYKALSADGTGYVSDLVEAIDWAIRNDVDVINFSIGTGGPSDALESKLNEASAAGIQLVAAAGNTGGGPLMYPAAYHNVIAVAATDSNDNFASFSSVGAEIAAPGVEITSTIPGGDYASWSGTSMATPHVTATMALMLANGVADPRQQLHDTAIDLGPAGIDSYFGYGLVNSRYATLGMDVLDPVVTFINPENGSEIDAETAEIILDVQDENGIKQAEFYINDVLVVTWYDKPYSYVWQTSEFNRGIYELRVKAVDNFDNVGEARITVTLVEPVTPTPTPSFTLTPSPTMAEEPDLTPTPGQKSKKSITPSPSPTMTITPSATPGQRYDYGEEVRQDTEQPTEEHRQDYQYTPPQPKSDNSSEHSNIPEVSNYTYRNQTAEEYHNNQQSTNEKGQVKGSTDVSFNQDLEQIIFRLLKYF